MTDLPKAFDPLNNELLIAKLSAYGFTKWTELLQCVLQDFRLECNFADFDNDLESLIYFLEHNNFLTIKWFQSNYMKLNEDKCNLLVAEHKYKDIWAKTGEAKIWGFDEQMLLVVQIDKNLFFDEHVSNFVKRLAKNYLF